MEISAVGFQQHGGAEVFEDLKVERPDAPPPGHVRVKVGAVALNHIDLWFRRGMPHLKLPMPHVPGSDVAGTVQASGPGVRGFEEGTPVVLAPGVSCGVCEHCQNGDDNMCRRFVILGEFIPGGQAEFVDVPAANVFRIPDNLSVNDAVSIPLVYLTAWALLVEKAKLTFDDTVLIHGISGGVSTAAVQMARLMGARVLGTTSSPQKMEAAKELGVEEVFDNTGDWVSEVRKYTRKAGVSVVIDHVGGELFSNSQKVLATSGRLITCGATAGPAPKFDLTRTYMRYNEIRGTRMGPRRALFPILRAFEREALRPTVQQVLPLTVGGVAEGHQMLEGRRVFGKIVFSRDP